MRRLPVGAAAVTTLTPVASKAAAPDQEVDFSSLFSSALLETPKKEEAPKAATTAEQRAKRVAEVAQKEREEAEKKAAEQVSGGP